MSFIVILTSDESGHEFARSVKTATENVKDFEPSYCIFKRSKFHRGSEKSSKSLMNSPTRFESHGKNVGKSRWSCDFFSESKFHRVKLPMGNLLVLPSFAHRVSF